jgi:peptidoglycan hydrolase-like protein with peptidoglycan-binding domain
MSNITDRAPRRIPEWLSLPDIARAWSEETGNDAAAFEAGFRVWFKDYLLRNAYGEKGAGGAGEDAGIPARLLEGRQIWRETFETFCEERDLAKPRFWFPGGGQASATPQPATPQPGASEPVPIADAGAAEPVAEAPKPPNQDDKAPSRRRVREGSTSFTWIAAGLVVAVVAGLVTLWLRDMEVLVADAGLMSGPVEEVQMSRVAPAEPAPVEPAPSEPAPAVAPAPAAASPTPEAATPEAAAPEAAAPAATSGPVAAPAPTTVSDPAAAQIAAAPSMAKRAEPSATPSPEAPAAGQAVAGEPVDQGLVLLLQRELQAAGYDPGPLDGSPGTRFAAAIATYQRANNLHADGRASIELLSRLARENLKAGRMAPLAPVVAPVVAPETGQGAGRSQTVARDSGATPQSRAATRVPAPRGRELVRAIQKRLSDRGYYGGPLDGSLGPKTREAIQTYQRVQRYDATGQPSRAIYEELEDYALEVRGLDQFQKGAYDAAVATYTRIIQRKPKNADAYFNRGLAYKNDGRTEQALSDYEAAIALDPAHRKAYFDRANILYERGLYRDALRAYFKALKLLLSIG